MNLCYLAELRICENLYEIGILFLLQEAFSFSTTVKSQQDSQLLNNTPLFAGEYVYIIYNKYLIWCSLSLLNSLATSSLSVSDKNIRQTTLEKLWNKQSSSMQTLITILEVSFN